MHGCMCVCVCVCVCVYLCSMRELPQYFGVRPALKDRRVRMDGRIRHGELEAQPREHGGNTEGTRREHTWQD
jgi:hypothetical protein